MAYANKIAVGASLEDFKKSFESIIAVEGCKTACATQLLTSMGLTPASTVFLSEIFREDEIIGVSSAEDDREIEMRVPEIIEELIKLSSKE